MPSAMGGMSGWGAQGEEGKKGEEMSKVKWTRVEKKVHALPDLICDFLAVGHSSEGNRVYDVVASQMWRDAIN